MSYEPHWYEQPLSVCPICKKKFAPAVFHGWKIGIESRPTLVCSYHCMREWERNKVDGRGRKKKK